MALNPRTLPVAGAANIGSYDSRQPLLTPNWDTPMAIANAQGSTSVGLMSPLEFLQNNPRDVGTLSATVGGTAATGDVLTLTFACGLLPNGEEVVEYTLVADDTIATAALGLINAINEDQNLNTLGVFATSGGEAAPDEVVINWPGPVSNFVTVTETVTGELTLTLTDEGEFTGGSGPILAFNNFTFICGSSGGDIRYFQAGQPYSVGFSVIRAMVAQGMPIV
jgi:hypothetical protein